LKGFGFRKAIESKVPSLLSVSSQQLCNFLTCSELCSCVDNEVIYSQLQHCLNDGWADAVRLMV